jgi:hypothetical protein
MRTYGAAGVRAVETAVKIATNWVPTSVIEAMITTAISEAMSPYSMAVTPFSESTDKYLAVFRAKL